LRLRRLRAALPPLPDLLAGALLWGAQMAVTLAVGLYIRNGWETSHFEDLALLFFGGGFFAWPFALPLGRFFAHGRKIETRFASFFVALTVCTIAMTAFFFALDYRVFYSRWHAPFLTEIWIFQFIFTGASAVYQFSVLGLGLFLPLGLVCLALTGMVLAKRMR
jgi:hypothetical protein